MAKNYKILSKDVVDYLCGLIRETVSIGDAIDDINLRSDGTSILVRVSNTGQLIHYTADSTKKYCGQYVYPVG